MASPLVAFPKTTFQRRGKKVLGVEDSAAFHSLKHPEVLSVLGWSAESILFMTREALLRRYLEATKFLVGQALKQGLNTSRRCDDRDNIYLELNGTTWIISVDGTYNKLLRDGHTTETVTVFTCFSQGNRLGFTADPTKLYNNEYLRLAQIFYEDSPECSSYIFEEMTSRWISGFEEFEKTWDIGTTSIIKILDRMVKSSCHDVEDDLFMAWEAE